VEANRRGAIEGIVLRYGLFYGPGNPATEKMIATARRRMLPVVRGDRSLLPCIHVADAVTATVAALDHGVPGATYDIVDDKAVSMTEIVSAIAEFAGAARPLAVPAWLPRLLAPYLARVTSVRLSLSNAKARTELGWRPRYPTYRDGLSEMLQRAA
jgi:nucleoside-diphosphate-sugar epimerase